MSSSEKNEGSQKWLRHGSKGFELAAAVGGLMFVGWWIGGHYGNTELGILIGAVLGIVGGMYNLIRRSLADSRRAEANRKNSEK